MELRSTATLNVAPRKRIASSFVGRATRADLESTWPERDRSYGPEEIAGLSSQTPTSFDAKREGEREDAWMRAGATEASEPGEKPLAGYAHARPSSALA
jgi:hypothetical protein